MVLELLAKGGCVLILRLHVHNNSFYMIVHLRRFLRWVQVPKTKQKAFEPK